MSLRIALTASRMILATHLRVGVYDRPELCCILSLARHLQRVASRFCALTAFSVRLAFDFAADTLLNVLSIHC